MGEKRRGGPSYSPAKEIINKPGALRVAIACNIRTDRSCDDEAEFDEPETVEAISAALKAGGFDTIILEATSGFPQKLEAASPDIVFNIAEGRSGRSREAQIPAILEYYGVPYTGSDAAALSVTLDKALTKRIVRSCGVETPPFRVIAKGEPVLTGDSTGTGGFDAAGNSPGELTDVIPFPVLVKPNAEGSSKGIPDDCVAENMPRLRALVDRIASNYKGDLLAEQYIDGREFTVGIIGNGPGVRVFEPMEIIYREMRGRYKVYSYEVKTNYRDYISYKCPPDLPPELVTRMKRNAGAIYQILGCMDFARIDFRLSNEGRVFFIEANLLPGFAPDYSDFPMLAGYNGMEYNALIREILDCALKRYGIKAVGQDGYTE